MALFLPQQIAFEAMGMALIVKYRGNHIIPCFSILFSSSLFLTPATSSTIFPFFKSENAGMVVTLNCWATCCFNVRFCHGLRRQQAKPIYHRAVASCGRIRVLLPAIHQRQSWWTQRLCTWQQSPSWSVPCVGKVHTMSPWIQSPALTPEEETVRK